MKNRPRASGGALVGELAKVVGEGRAVAPVPPSHLHDASVSRGLRGRADALVVPETEQQVRAAVAWCCARDVAIVVRGGGSGYAAGAVPGLGEDPRPVVVLACEGLNRVLSVQPGAWRMHVQAGVTTATVRRLARESGLLYGPDPGAGEVSHIGGNIATNAGGPHTLGHGTTGRWVTGLSAVVAPGETLSVGGPLTKDAAGYDLRGLLVGSEGTLGVITSAWLRLVPAPAAAGALAAFYPDLDAGAAALTAVREAGLTPSALEFLDGGALAAAAAGFPGDVPPQAMLGVLAEVEGDPASVADALAELKEVLRAGAIAVASYADERQRRALWRWRDGVSPAVVARLGGKLSEDVVVPVERLAEAIGGVLRIGDAHGLPACSWGHAGDGNVHGTFLLDPADADAPARAQSAAEDLFALAVGLGGSVSGEHGLGWVKRGALALQWDPAALRLHDAIKRAWDPGDVFNPGKKVAAASTR